MVSLNSNGVFHDEVHQTLHLDTHNCKSQVVTIVDQRPQRSVAIVLYSSCIFLEEVDCRRMSKVLLAVLGGPMLIMLALSLFKIKHGDMCLAAEGVLGVFTL